MRRSRFGLSIGARMSGRGTSSARVVARRVWLLLLVVSVAVVGLVAVERREGASAAASVPGPLRSSGDFSDRPSRASAPSWRLLRR